MRGTSALSLGNLLEELAQTSGASARTGGELFGAAAVIDQSPPLRRVLTDPSTEADAKRGLVASLFGDSLGSQALALLEDAVASRWAASRDFTDALEIAGVESWAAAAQDSGQLDTLEDELFAVTESIVVEEELRRTIGDRAVAPNAKASLLADIYSGKISEPALAIITQAAASRSGSFERVVERFAQQVAKRRGRLVAEVTVAYQLDESEKQRLTAALKKKYGSDIQLNLVVDSSVVGGIAVSIGDEVVDATMSTRLEAARRLLAG